MFLQILSQQQQESNKKKIPYARPVPRSFAAAWESNKAGHHQRRSPSPRRDRYHDDWKRDRERGYHERERDFVDFPPTRNWDYPNDRNRPDREPLPHDRDHHHHPNFDNRNPLHEGMHKTIEESPTLPGDFRPSHKNSMANGPENANDFHPNDGEGHLHRDFHHGPGQDRGPNHNPHRGPSQPGQDQHQSFPDQFPKHMRGPNEHMHSQRPEPGSDQGFYPDDAGPHGPSHHHGPRPRGPGTHPGLPPRGPGPHHGHPRGPSPGMNTQRGPGDDNFEMHNDINNENSTKEHFHNEHNNRLGPTRGRGGLGGTRGRGRGGSGGSRGRGSSGGPRGRGSSREPRGRGRDSHSKQPPNDRNFENTNNDSGMEVDWEGGDDSFEKQSNEPETGFLKQEMAMNAQAHTRMRGRNRPTPTPLMQKNLRGQRGSGPRFRGVRGARGRGAPGSIRGTRTGDRGRMSRRGIRPLMME